MRRKPYDMQKRRPLYTSALPIRLVSVSKSYKSVGVLERTSLAVEAGEFVTLLGPSGSGKTTILNIIAGFLMPDAGEVYFADTDVTFLPPHKRDLGVVFQNYALFPHMSVAENVAFPLRARKVPVGEITAMVERSLDLVQLRGYGTRRVHELSGGQRQRVALARAVVFEPKIILMDEPLSALDKQLRERMQIELRQLHMKLGATIIYVTHDQREALTMSDRIAVLNKGAIAQFDTPKRIYDEPANAFVAEFLGETTMFQVERLDASTVRFGDTTLSCRTMPPQGSSDLRLVLRTEYLSLASSCDTRNVLSGLVDELVYQGDSILVMVALRNGARVTMRHPVGDGAVGRLPAIGEAIALSLPPAQTVVIPA